MTYGARPRRCTNRIQVGMMPTHPDYIIRADVIKELRLNVTRNADNLGGQRSPLSARLKSNAALTPEMLLRIEKASDVSMDHLLGVQAWFDT